MDSPVQLEGQRKLHEPCHAVVQARTVVRARELHDLQQRAKSALEFVREELQARAIVSSPLPMEDDSDSKYETVEGARTTELPRCYTCNYPLETPFWYCLDCEGKLLRELRPIGSLIFKPLDDLMICQQCNQAKERESPWIFEHSRREFVQGQGNRGQGNCQTFQGCDHPWSHSLVLIPGLIDASNPAPMSARMDSIDSVFTALNATADELTRGHRDTQERIDNFENSVNQRLSRLEDMVERMLRAVEGPRA
jgi:hypothetical protein